MPNNSESRMMSQGGRRQGSSGAWIFPVNPKEKERKLKMKELDVELDEVRKLKEELVELRDNLTE